MINGRRARWVQGRPAATSSLKVCLSCFDFVGQCRDRVVSALVFFEIPQCEWTKSRQKSRLNVEFGLP